MNTERRRHLIFLAHVWASAPFALVWLLIPGMRTGEQNAIIAGQWVLALVAGVYLVVRTWLAWRDKPRIPWNYLYPIPDIALISLSLHMTRSTESVLYYTYLLPIIAAASTLNVPWAAFIGLLSVLGALAATMGLAPVSYLGAAYRLVSLLLLASLTTWLARLAADVRARLSVAEERNRIAMEMHDGVQASLIAIASQMELAGRIAEQEPGRAASIASDCRNLARQAADDLRFLVHRLRAQTPAEAFVPAIRQYLHNIAGRSGVAVHLDAADSAEGLGPKVEHALFRILQESMNNALKHAEADEVRVRLACEPERIMLSIRDNGRGFNAQHTPSEGHAGITGMKETMNAVGGTLDIQSRAGEGTTVTASVPRTNGRKVGWLSILRR
jgi:signal transduction histidine kinase